jgi:CTP:molybdopterin cytidylyltransferase MocA
VTNKRQGKRHRRAKRSAAQLNARHPSDDWTPEQRAAAERYVRNIAAQHWWRGQAASQRAALALVAAEPDKRVIVASYGEPSYPMPEHLTRESEELS